MVGAWWVGVLDEIQLELGFWLSLAKTAGTSQQSWCLVLCSEVTTIAINSPQLVVTYCQPSQAKNVASFLESESKLKLTGENKVRQGKTVK